MSFIAAAVVAAAQSMPILATDAALLFKEADEARREQICLTHDEERALTWFQRRYGRRLQQIEIWFKSRFSEEDLASAKVAVEGDGVSTADCHLNRNGRPSNYAEKAFLRRLRMLERRISNGNKTYP